MAALAALATACSFRGAAVDDGGGNGSGPDAGEQRPDASDSQFAAAHVPISFWEKKVAVVSWTNGETIEIDTSDLSITGIDDASTDPSFEAAPQDGNPADAKEIALLRLGSLEVGQNVSITVEGNRPLVIVASASVAIAGMIDGSADGERGGPGSDDLGRGGKGGAPTLPGSHQQRGGGGGGGFGSNGTAGGGSTCTDCVTVSGGNPGSAYGDPAQTILYGGSRGGEGPYTDATDSGCDGKRGAGGGAIQISAVGEIAVSGTIVVGGGGGSRGQTCFIPLTVIERNSGGGGGGSGGAIYLESSTRVVVSGVLAANGGAGAGGHGGEDGSDALSATSAAPGGMGGAESERGGDGGFVGASPTAGLSSGVVAGSGGGGGGGVGRITVSGQAELSAAITPTAHELP